MMRKIAIALVAGAALAGAPAAHAAMHGGGGFGGGHSGGSFAGGHVGGGFGGSFGGAHVGSFGGSFGGARVGSLGGTHFGSGLGAPHVTGSFGGTRLRGQAFGSPVVSPNVAQARGRIDHDRGLGRHVDHQRRFVRGFGYWPGWDTSTYDDDCSYVSPYYRYDRYAYGPYGCYAY